MSTSTAPSIALILCTTRNPRCCPQVAAYVQDILKNDPSQDLPPYSLHIIDLAEWNLPFMDEPAVPSQVTDPSNYIHEHTRAWSKEIQKHAGFIFVTPQYNWGYSAACKNAIDFLFNEWVGKASMIVSYGGHGGGKAAGQLRQVLNGVRMNVAETMSALAFPSRKEQAQAAGGKDLNLLGADGMWASERVNILTAFGELMGLLAKQ